MNYIAHFLIREYFFTQAGQTIGISTNRETALLEQGFITQETKNIYHDACKSLSNTSPVSVFLQSKYCLMGLNMCDSDTLENDIIDQTILVLTKTYISGV